VSGNSIDVTGLQESQGFYPACNLFYQTELFHLSRARAHTHMRAGG